MRTRPDNRAESLVPAGRCVTKQKREDKFRLPGLFETICDDDDE